MKVVGLTGGIATGKSTVASMLRKLGAEIIDADQLAREIVQPGREAWQGIVDAFGAEIVRRDKGIDREKLRKIVFKDPEAKQKLEIITHPPIRKLAQERIRQLASEGAEVIVYEAPLLFEKKVHLWIRPVILVNCDPAIQRQRLGDRDGLSEEEIEQHLRAQMPMQEKIKLADFVIGNDGDREELQRRVEALWGEIRDP